MGRVVAAIDVGTNTVLLLVARMDEDGTLVPVTEAFRIPRLGAGVDARGTLNPEAVARVIAVLNEYREIAVSCGAGRIVVCATSAVRDAANRDHFIRLVRHETGLTVEVLSGDKEALWSYHGAISNLPPTGQVLVLDIGGGSTEMIWGDAATIHTHISCNIGAVRLTERCFLHDPPSDAEIDAAAGLIEAALGSIPFTPLSAARLVAVAGTPTTLATLALGLKEFSQMAVAGYVVTREVVERLWNQLRRLPAADIRRLSNVLEGRADVITAGTLILRMVMDRFKFDAMTVSDRGLRYGLLLREQRPDDNSH
jgi:exopolyphosphatase / guanosine-5'-triphosphate,3'-diphosphate pyrophosphatase